MRKESYDPDIVSVVDTFSKSENGFIVDWRQNVLSPLPPAPNNSFNRSANSVTFIRKTCMLDTIPPRPVNSGIGRLCVMNS